jgi:hypothetical protein
MSSPAGPLPEAVLDRDPATSWTSPEGLRPGAAFEVRLSVPHRLDALILALDLEAPPLVAPWIVEVEGALVARGPTRYALQWVNGAPRAGRQALLVIPLGGGAATSVRLLFQGSGPPLEILEAFLYGPDEEARPRAGEEAARRALAASRAGRWPEAERLYREAIRAEPDRASHHAGFLRARWRAARRQMLDVESLGDGGPGLVLVP